MNRLILYNYRFYCQMIPKTNNRLMDIKTFVFLDIETTGLPRMENNKTKITELCMVAVEASHIQLGVFPRVQNKLNVCFNPWKLISTESEKMTGLSNPILEHQSKFSSDTINTINCFLNHNQKPLCFVAHNGTYFDYPILQREVEKSGNSLIDDIVCIDSLHMFRQLHYEEENVAQVETTAMPSCLSLSIETTVDETEDGGNTLPQKILEAKKLNETTPKKQMVETFPSIPNPAKRLKLMSSKTNTDFKMTKRSPIKEHQAEGDVLMLITCAATLGEKFVNWANVNAKNFCDIPSMAPGKKIGT
ncbi:three-prime repair exonuclease 1 isoform X2 [Anoplophora glabripennis]|uniref:three-prime repair exonuclease 1 isoform X2 n=1 Tax=Anoplophora glabripennis TaxID=217634 RepID=UPI000875826E|nr:three-prime repair exonuclease 1 isoform X2 [Anoplophora glabripennis]